MKEKTELPCIPRKREYNTSLWIDISISSEVNLNKEDSLYNEYLKSMESQLFEQVLVGCRYNKSQAVRVLGISRQTFNTKLKLYFPGKYIE